MIKLLIVEDETAERDFLRDHIAWEIIGGQVVNDAWNGKEAVEMVITSRPDIIITDIKMPVMDGVEMAKVVHAIDPSIKIIFHSAYDDFEYAREAVNLNAFGYILKPFNEEELLRLVKKAADKCIQEKMNEAMLLKLKSSLTMGGPVLREALVRDMLLGEEIQQDELLRSAGLEWLVRPQSAYFMVLTAWGDSSGFHSADFITEAECLLSRFKNSVPVKLTSNEAVILLHADAERDDRSEMVEAGCESIKTCIWDKYGAAVRYLYACAVTDDNKQLPLKEMYEQLAGEMKRCSVMGNGSETPGGNGPHIHMIHQFKEDFSTVLRMRDEQRLHGLIRSFCESQFPRHTSDLPYYAGIGFSVLTVIADAVKAKGYEPFATVDEEIYCWTRLVRLNNVIQIKQYVLQQAVFMIEKIKEGNKGGQDQLIGQIEQIVKKRYHEPLTVEYIAGLMHFTPNYLGATFKSKRNISINDYINKIRVSKSMELLGELHLSVSDIALKCGYENAPYFYKIFKKLTGITPGEFRLQVTRQAGTDNAE